MLGCSFSISVINEHGKILQFKFEYVVFVLFRLEFINGT